MNKDLKKVISKVSGVKEDEDQEDLIIKLIEFDLDNEIYAVNIVDVKEVINMPKITPVPNTQDYIKGIMNLRGDIVVIIDLEKRLGLVRENQASSKHVLIAEINGNVYGVIVDEVKEIINIPEKNIQQAPALTSERIKNNYIKGVVIFDKTQKSKEVKKSEVAKEVTKAKAKNSSNRLVILLDILKILQDKEISTLGKDINKELNK